MKFKFLLFVLCVCGLCLGNVLSASLSSIIAGKEAETRAIADKAKTLYVGRCFKSSKCKASKCSVKPDERTSMVPQCGNEMGPGGDCSSELGKVPDGTCSHCNKKKQKLDFNEGYLRLPYGPKSEKEKEIAAETACWMKDLSETYVSNDEKRKKDGVLRAWQYFGSHQAGVTNMYPGSLGAYARNNSDCGNYDPRRRPWYVAASSGPKDVVLVLDTSGSMRKTTALDDTSRIEMLIAAANAVLDTLTSNDFVSVVSFSDTAKQLGGSNSRLRRATPDNVKALQDAVNDMLPAGGTRFVPALTLAKDILQQQNADYTSGCQKIILFLTDGEDTSISSSPSSWNTLKTDLKNAGIVVVSFSMGSNADDTLPQDIACETNGVWSKVSDAANPTAAMTSYYELLALSVKGDSAPNVAWTSPYEDAGGLGKMVSVAMPVYHTNGDLIGVASTDVLMRELEAAGAYQTVLNSLIERSKACPNFKNVANFTCPAARLRVSSQCPNYVLPSGCSAVEEAACQKINLDDVSCVQFDATTLKPRDGKFKKLKSLYCCNCLNLAAIIACSVIGGLFVLVGIPCIIYQGRKRGWFTKCKRNTRKRDEENQKSGVVQMSVRQAASPSTVAPASRIPVGYEAPMVPQHYYPPPSGNPNAGPAPSAPSNSYNGYAAPSNAPAGYSFAAT